jgi:hypothetical protein
LPVCAGDSKVAGHPHSVLILLPLVASDQQRRRENRLQAQRSRWDALAPGSPILPSRSRDSPQPHAAMLMRSRRKP